MDVCALTDSIPAMENTGHALKVCALPAKVDHRIQPQVQRSAGADMQNSFLTDR
jgi:hypothetical protein